MKFLLNEHDNFGFWYFFEKVYFEVYSDVVSTFFAGIIFKISK